MGKGKTILVRKDLIAVDEFSELDFELYDSFDYDYEVDDIKIIDSIKDASVRQRARYYVDTTPLEISKLEKLLKRYKKKGATHIAMEHHPDHIGYEFSGFNIELADDELIKVYETELAKKLELLGEHAKIRANLTDIEKDLKKLKV